MWGKRPSIVLTGTLATRQSQRTCFFFNALFILQRQRRQACQRGSVQHGSLPVTHGAALSGSSRSGAPCATGALLGNAKGCFACGSVRLAPLSYILSGGRPLISEGGGDEVRWWGRGRGWAPRTPNPRPMMSCTRPIMPCTRRSLRARVCVGPLQVVRRNLPQNHHRQPALPDGT